jgi:hypothetical protein
MAFKILETAHHVYHGKEIGSHVTEAFQSLHEARKGSHLDMAESVLETQHSVGSCFNYIVTLPAYLGHIGAQVAALASSLLEKVSPFLAHLPLAQVLVDLGIAMGVVTVIKESLALSRQLYFLHLFNQSSWKTDPAGAVESLKHTYPVFFKRSLPEWLFEKINGPEISHKEREKQATLQYLVKDHPQLYTPQPFVSTLTAQEQVDKIESYVTKKAVYHALVIAAAVVGIVVSLATAGLPILTSLTILAGVAFVLAIVCYLYKAGVLNNPDGGFSLKYCIPEVVRNIPAKIQAAGKDVVQRIEEWQMAREAHNKLITDFL